MGHFLGKSKISTVSLFCLLACIANAQNFVTGQAARAAIGQPNFTSGQPGTAANLVGGASGVAFDPKNGLLWVADSNRLAALPQNNRVVAFPLSQIPAPNADLTQMTPPTSACGLCGFGATVVLGQPDFITSNPGRAQTATPANGSTAATGSMETPTAVATDGNYLAVADTDNNRVLIWNPVPTSNNAAPNIVLGQTNFTSFQTPQPVNANSLRGPQGVWIQNGSLFVADTQNYRILIWKQMPTQNNQAADLVLGQASFTSVYQPPITTGANYPSTTASLMLNPTSVTSDGTRLFVADLGNNRVLIWNNAFVNGKLALSNDQPADVVVGQPLLTTAVPNWSGALCGAADNSAPCAATLDYPRFALSDGTRLFIADGGNDRVLIYNTIPTQNGAKADEVLGQVDFVTDQVSSETISITSTTVDNTGGVDIVSSPTSLAFDGVNLYVADPFNRRVLVFTPGNTPLPPKSAVNWASEIIRQEGLVTFAVTSGGAITANDTVTITIQGTAYTYTIVKGDTLDTIAQGIAKVINSSNSGAGDPNATALFAGNGTGSVYLSSKATSLAFDSISLAASTSNTGNITATTSGSYLSAGNAGTGAAGMLVEIDGSNLSDNTATAPLAGQLPVSLGGVEVFMDGLPSPVLSVSPTQIISEIPFTFTNGSDNNGNFTGSSAFTDRNSTSIYVRTVHNDGSVTITNATPMYIAPANPGLFSAPAYSGQPRPYPAINAYHQPGNPTVVVSVDGTVTAGNTASLTIGSNTYTYTVVSGDSLLSIAQNLVNKINSAPDPNVTASLGGAYQRIILTAIQPGQAGTGIAVSATSSAGATVTLTPYTTKTCCAVIPGTLITPVNPAVPGELISISATGLGTVQDTSGHVLSVPTGQPWTGTTLNSAVNAVTATMNGETAQVITAGLTPGGYGMYSIQMVVPSDLPNNPTTQLYVAQNAFLSNTVTIAVGPANPIGNSTASPIAMSIDYPSSGATASGTINIGGWALDTNASISSVTILMDGVNLGAASIGGARPDVCASNTSPDCPNVGYNFGFDTTALADGVHTLQVRATASDGSSRTLSASFTISNYNPSTSPTRLNIDQPSGASLPFQGGTTFSGWAVNTSAPVSSVVIYIDGAKIGNATYGLPRPDVCAANPAPGCPNTGWTIPIDTTVLANGTHTVSAFATASNGQRSGISSSFTVANWTSSGNPVHISIDSPNNSSTYSGTIGVGGWALATNVVISTVSIAVDGVPYGNAAYGGARADACGAFSGAPSCPNVGWNSSIDTTLLADGVHTIAVTVATIYGQTQTLSSTFKVANLVGSNPMHLNIDQPNSNTVSGTATAAGWAISDNAAVASVQISIDGVPSGTAGYGLPRADVCAVFTGRTGCPNVGWSYSFDTTLLSNGTHTISATAISASGTKGTVSSSFTVSNVASSSGSVLQPNAADNPFQGLASFSGGIPGGSSSTSVGITIDGVSYGSANLITTARSIATGWSFTLDTNTLANGTHTLGVIRHYLGSSATLIGSATFNVANWTSSGNPMNIDIDSPGTSGAVSGALNLGGWVSDTAGAVSTVSVSIDGIPYGNATYGVSRPDVCSAYPNSQGCPNVGWSFPIDTHVLSNGAHTIAVTANAGGGQSYTVSRTFSVAN